MVEETQENQEKGTIIQSTLAAMVDAALSIEKIRVRSVVRQTHLALRGRRDEETDNLVEKLKELESYIDGRAAERITSHPAYHWFSKVPGVGKENICKIVGPIRVKPEKGTNKAGEEIDLPYADTISALWKFAGFGVEDGKAPKRVKGGGKLSYNSQLRSMCWRLASSLQRAGLRHKCLKCGELIGVATLAKLENRCPKCDGDEFGVVATTHFSDYYLKEKGKYVERYLSRGVQIVPASKLPKDKEGKRYEPDGMISEGHVHNQALRKMIKLFLACLWLVWRETEGLPVSAPYPLAILKHNHFIDPWQMIDK